MDTVTIEVPAHLLAEPYPSLAIASWALQQSLRTDELTDEQAAQVEFVWLLGLPVLLEDVTGLNPIASMEATG